VTEPHAQQDHAGTGSSVTSHATFVSVQVAEMPGHGYRADTAIRVQLRDENQPGAVLNLMMHNST